VQYACEATVHLPERRQRDRRPRRHGQGLRVRQGPIRRLQQRRDQGARRKGDRLDRHRGIRALSKVDREYVDRSYFLGPDKGGDRAYRLLAAALADTGKAALGQYAAKGKQYLVLLRPKDGVLVMEQLHYADEVRSPTEVTIPAGDVKPTELALAKQLIEQTATDSFEPAKFKDTVRDRQMELIQQKIEGQDITQVEAPADTGGKIIDLMEALKASLAATTKSDERAVKAS